MKKVILLSMVILMVLAACLTGCTKTTEEETQTTEVTTEQTTAEETTEEAVEMPHYVIGVMLYTLSTDWAKNIISRLDYLGEQFNCEFQYVEAGTPDLYISTIENLCQSGIDGFITCQTGTMTQQLLDVCAANGVYMVVSQNNVSADTGYEDFSVNSEYFCGYVYEDDYTTAYNIASDMIAKGAETFCLHSLPLGIAAQMDDRFNGAADAINDGGGTVLGEGRSFAKGEAAQNLLSQFPEVDAIFTTVSGVENVAQPIAALGRTGDVLLNSYESGEGTYEALADNAVQYVIEGQCVDTMFSFVLLYNAMNGTPLKPADGGAVALEMPYIVVTSAEEYTDLEEYVFGEMPAFTADELKAYMPLFVADATYESFKILVESFSLDDVKARHAE